ncbi:RtcB family protein [Pseudomonas aeruginosa]|uniref:RtcB family protein n=1 Tax=Pseudomonas aeruginosa TaxID=287 RepID=UPI0037494A8A
MLNGLWLGFFLVAAASALARWLIGGDATVFAAMVESLFAMAKLAVEVMVLLFGTLTLWLGFLRIAEKAGLVERLAVLLGPLFRRLMPEVPPGHPAIGLITLNFAANGLGLDNAATPIGLKAMKALQELNPSSTTASNAQILFLVLNASSLTLLPVTIFMYRAQQGAADPTLVFLPILLATSASTLAGLLSVALMQRLRLWDPVVLAYLIPGSRGDYSYLVEPVPSAQSLFSLAHGAGRKWQRGECRERLAARFSVDQLGRTHLGSRVICGDRQLIYEEAPEAYKGIDSVVGALLEAGLLRLVARLKPVLTYKTRGECCR